MSDVERERVTALWREAAAAVEGAGSPDIPRPTPCAECGRLREQLDAARQALEEIAAANPHKFQARIIARAALGVEGEQE